MMKRILAGLVSCLVVTAAVAAPPKPGTDLPEGFDARSPDLLPPGDPFRMEKADPSEDDVGDADSFEKEVIYLGVAQTDSVRLRSDCSPIPPDAGPCIELPPDRSDTTSVDEFGLATIELPAGVTNSLICFTVTNFTQWNWQNTTGSQEFAQMTINLSTQIENDALLGLVDADGDPFNGLLFDGDSSTPGRQPLSLTTFFEFRSLDAGDFLFKFPSRTRSCTGGFVSRNSLEAQGLTDEQIDDFFDTPMTITFGARGNASSITSGSFFWGIRLYGDSRGGPPEGAGPPDDAGGPGGPGGGPPGGG